jgi:hypothetical protein
MVIDELSRILFDLKLSRELLEDVSMLVADLLAG